MSENLLYSPLCKYVMYGYLQYNEQLVVVVVISLQEAIPLAVVGSNTMLEVNGKRVRGRIYPWGVVEGINLITVTMVMHYMLLTVENKDHCDFVLLRDMIVR